MLFRSRPRHLGDRPGLEAVDRDRGVLGRHVEDLPRPGDGRRLRDVAEASAMHVVPWLQGKTYDAICSPSHV